MPDAAQTFADLLLALLDDWKKFGKFLLLVFFACLLALGLVYGILRSLPRDERGQAWHRKHSFQSAH